MKAIRILEPGGPKVLQLLELDAPETMRGCLRVRVHACGVNRADILQRKGLYPAPADAPQDIPGLEYAGEVLEVRANGSPFRPGDRVMGILSGGGYSQQVMAPAGTALPVPDPLSWEEAAAVPEAFLTAYDALFRQLQVEPGQRVLIHAVASGVGLAAVQLCSQKGIRTFGTSRTDEKLEFAKGVGLEVAINSTAQDFRRIIEMDTGGSGVDAVADLIGGENMMESLRCLRPRGRLILVGLLAGRKAELDLGLILTRRRLRITGTVLRSRSLAEKEQLCSLFRDDWLEAFSCGNLRPNLDRIFPLEQAAAAHLYMEGNKNAGKIVLKVP